MSITTIFSVVSSFFQSTWAQPWKRRLILASGFVACVALGYSLGRFAVPAKVETIEKEKIVTKIETQIEYRDRIVYEKQKAEVRIVYKDRIVQKDGTIREREKEVYKSQEQAKLDEAKEKKENTTTNQILEKEKIKIVTNQPRWRVGVDVGWSMQDPKLTIAGPLIIGVRVDYRVIGGLGVGAWVNSSVAAGAGLSYQF